MASKRNPQTAAKREREQAVREKRQRKIEKKQAAAAEKARIAEFVAGGGVLDEEGNEVVDADVEASEATDVVEPADAVEAS